MADLLSQRIASTGHAPSGLIQKISDVISFNLKKIIENYFCQYNMQVLMNIFFTLRKAREYFIAIFWLRKNRGNFFSLAI